MELGLLKLIAFLRPIFFIDIEQQFLGLNFFELLAIVSSSFLVLAFLSRAALQRDIRFSTVDGVIALFAIWCLTSYVIYPDRSYVADLARLLIPLFTYFVAKNVLRDREQYLKVTWIMICGFTVPIVWSSILILRGSGLDRIDYWTGIPRYLGVYDNPHNMGHNMVLLFFAVTIYIAMSGDELRRKMTWRLRVGFLAALCLAALFCLYESRVRTSILGLLIFLGAYFAATNRKVLIVGSICIAFTGFALAPVLVPTLLNDAAMVEAGRWDPDELGSGRPQIWEHNWKIFSALPIDRQLAGVGIGNESLGGVRISPDGVINSHNDLFHVLMQTGVIGFLLFMTLQVLLLRQVLRLSGKERYLFLALFMSVFIMNFVSNSYIFRFGVAQLYYILLAFIEIPAIQGERSPQPVSSARSELARPQRTEQAAR